MLGTHIDNDSVLSWIPFLGHVPEVKVTASDNVMILIISILLFLVAATETFDSECPPDPWE